MTLQLKYGFLTVLAFSLVFPLYGESDTTKPRQIVLTWQGDTQTTMTITWRTDEKNARTAGMKLIDDSYATDGDHIDYLDVRSKLIKGGWKGSGYESPDDAFIALAMGIMNHTDRDSRFAYQFLLNNWQHFVDHVGFEQELLPDRKAWSQIYDGIAENRLYYSTDHNAFNQDFNFSDENLPDHIHIENAESYTFPETSAWLHRVELTGLKPGTTYSVLLKSDRIASNPFTFRTAPKDREAFTFIVGSDTQSETEERKQMTAHAATLDPEFIMMSGDLVMRGLSEVEWDNWFDEWHELMVTDDGRRVPIIPAMGNHDVRGWIMGDFEIDAAFFANRFNLPEPQNYYALEYGDGFLIITLDSGHTSAFDELLEWFPNTGYYEGGQHKVRSSHDGQQRDWLEQTLKDHRNNTWKMIHYHINAFATSQQYWESQRYGRRIMHQSWIPLFEEYGIDLIHEGHGHRLKRSHPVKDGEIHEEGVTYIGEGGWGTHMSMPDPLWFVADKGNEHHFWQISLDEGWNTLTGWPVKWIDGAAVTGQTFTIEQ
tara:strand:- start:12441 stop:14063 length:1623 start_codon:yes stop_codon:yes gene_type:complete